MSTRLAHRRRLAAVAIALVLGTGAALAQDSSSSASAPSVPANAESFIGQWLLATDDSAKTACPINLTDQAAAANSWVVQPLDACPSGFPTIASWAVEDGGNTLILLDAGGQPALTMRQNPSGLLDNTGTGEPLMYLLAPYEQAGGEQDTD
jgi:hypothetical protein